MDNQGPTTPNKPSSSQDAKSAQKDQPVTSISGTGSSMQQPQQPSQPTQQPRPKVTTGQRRTNPIYPAIAILLVLLIATAGYLYSTGALLKGPSSTTLKTTSTIGSTSVGAINNCMTISSSGKYFLASSFKTNITQGACININASNVNFICDNNKLTGSGPFVDIAPFTYAVQVDDQHNVTVSGCTIRNFSYGIFAVSSNQLNLNNNNLSINYMANIYLNNTHNSTLSNNYMSRASSVQGSLFLTNGTSGVQVLNNTIQYNQFYGINVNTSNNTFRNNYINGTQFSFRCSTSDGFVISSKASQNTCYNSTGCGFLECRDTNIPANILLIALSNKISTCGTISSPGTYTLQSNLNMGDYVNVSNPLSQSYPCITVKSKNVNINCNDFKITNATTAILASDDENFTLQNCNIDNSSVIGLLVYNTSVSHFSNLSFQNDAYGIELFNASINSFSNVSASKDTYGVLLTQSFSNTFQGLNASHNTYGAYLESNSYSNIFNHDVIANNSKVDVYATPDSANVSINLMQSTVCGLTNALWANECRNFVETSLAFQPLNGCSRITMPGNYLLQSSINNVAGICLNVTRTVNVELTCANHTIITAGLSTAGPGLLISNSRNISVIGCGFAGFANSVSVTNSSQVNLGRLHIQGASYGVTFNRSQGSSFANSTINGTKNASIFLYHTTSTTVLNNTISLGLSRNTGISINDSQNNFIINNSGSRNYIGLEFVGASANNTVQNNTMLSNTKFDYLCSGDSALSSENGGINYGTTKSGCYWMAALLQNNAAAQCSVAQSPSLFSMSQDYRYTTGTVCYTALANDTTINCEGHTVIATNGGTFAVFKNSQNSEVENCNLKGFTNSIIVKNSTITLFNNTIFENSTATTAVSIIGTRTNGNGAAIVRNNLTATNIAILLTNSNGGIIKNNIVSGANSAYMLQNVTAYTITNNTAAPSTTNGLSLNNSLTDFVQQNTFLSSTVGLSCIQRSQGQLNNSDEGGNVCSTQSNCFWIKSSGQRCP
jgi:parallel beta-helix repeat protein